MLKLIFLNLIRLLEICRKIVIDYFVNSFLVVELATKFSIQKGKKMKKLTLALIVIFSLPVKANYPSYAAEMKEVFDYFEQLDTYNNVINLEKKFKNTRGFVVLSRRIRMT